MKFADYQNGVIEIMGKMVKTTAAEQQAETKYKEEKKWAQVNLDEGIYGRKGFEQRNQAAEKARTASREAYNAEMAKHREEFDKLTADAFKIEAKGINADMCQILGLIEPTKDELSRLIIETKPENHTMVRVLFSQAKEHGIDLCDDTPAYLKDVRENMKAFADHCNNATIMEAYSDNLGVIVEKFGTNITKAGADYLASPGIPAEHAAAVA